MKTAFIFHDSFCDPFSEWYPWMKTRLEAMGYAVVVPKFPTPQGQSYASWKAVMNNHTSAINTETLFIGHGTGALFALRLLEESAVKIRGTFLVAGYAEKIGNVAIDRINETFYEPVINWGNILTHTLTVKVIAGSDDPFVPQSLSEQLAEHLNESAQIIPDGGHLGKAAGFEQMIPLLAIIQESLSSLDKSIRVDQSDVGLNEEIIPEPIEDSEKIELAQEVSDTSEEEEEVVPVGKNTEDETLIENSSQVTQTPSVQARTQVTPPQSPRSMDGMRVHTMYQDMSHAVHSNKGSVASSLLTKARVDDAEKEAASPLSQKNIFYIIGSLLCMIALGVLGFYLYQRYAPAQVDPAVSEIPSLIRADEHVKVGLSAEPFFITRQKISNALQIPLESDRIRDIVYVSGAGFSSFTELGKALAMPTLPSEADQIFTPSPRELPVMMHGVFKQKDREGHFLIVRVNRYDDAFTFMKSWEPTMTRDLGPLMNISENYLKRKLTRDTFTDELVYNRTLRVNRYQAGALIDLTETPAPITGDASTTEPEVISPTIPSNNALIPLEIPYNENDLVLTYFFLNERTLVITDSFDIIPEIINRYANRQIYTNGE